MGVVRPLQSLLIERVIFPAVNDFALDYDNVLLTTDVDEIDIITQWPKPDHLTKIELPLNGYVWLALALFWGAGNRKLIRILLIYELVLIFVMPIAGLLILEGHRWMIIAVSIHEKLYKFLFLILGLLAVRSAVLSLKKETAA